MHSAQSAAQCTAGECGPWRGIPGRSDSGEEKIFSPNWKNILIQYLSFAGHRTLNFATKVWQIIWRSHSISSIFVLSYLQGLRFVFSWSRGLLIYVPLQRKCEICVRNCKIVETEGQLLWFLERMSAHGCCKEKPRDVWCARQSARSAQLQCRHLDLQLTHFLPGLGPASAVWLVTTSRRSTYCTLHPPLRLGNM